MVDDNLYEPITYCAVQRKNHFLSEIHVTYRNGEEERIWTFNHKRYNFDPGEFIGMSKIEAVFYCDRKLPVQIR